ncbi:MAG: two-component regulator propeller domain-containing protein, partial [Saprospiraceae bacterium]|nr:two-component regulator propeller domain-containing protein [Saprospiraceae bacterium]
MLRNALIALLAVMAVSTVMGQRFTSLNDEFPFARTRCVYQDTFGFLWFGTVDGLVKFDGLSTRTYRNAPDDPLSLPGQEILAITENSDTTLLLGFQDMGLVHFNRNTGRSQLLKINGEQERLSVFCLLIDHNGVVWAGTDRGLFAMDEDSAMHYSADASDGHGLQNPVVLSLYEDHHRNLWIGTYAGIHLLDRQSGQFTHPGTNASFPDDIIIDIEEDREGRLWVSERLGPVRLSTWDQEARRFHVEDRFVRDGEFRIDFDVQNTMWISSR